MTAPSTATAFYAALFSDAARASVYHLPHGDHRNLLEGAQAAECLVIDIDLSGARNKDDMLTALAKSLRFPEWFGGNWDALNDCLLDMGWLPATGYVLILHHCDGVHGRAENDFVTLMQLMQEVADQWREDDVPFWCLVDMQADGVAWLPTIAQPE